MMTETTVPAAGHAIARVGVRWLALLVPVAVATLAVGVIVVERVTELPAANTDYSVVIDPGVHPVTPNGRAAAIARRYLDDQTSELAAPGIRVPPVIFSATASLARDARRIEPAIPEAAATAQPDRVVWVVRATGDMLILHDLPWSSAGTPYPSGTIVIDDATGSILGVYPREPGT
jgi:hypothetical protein